MTETTIESVEDVPKCAAHLRVVSISTVQNLFFFILVQMKYVMIANLFTQADTFVQLLDGEDSDEKAVTAMGILNTLETMLNVMERSKEVHVSYNNDYCN